MTTKKDLLIRLKEIRKEYVKSNNVRRIRLMEASEFLFREIERRDMVVESDVFTGIGRVGRVEAEAYLCYGDAFLLREWGITMEQVLIAIDKY